MIREYCLTIHQCILADIDPAMGKIDIQNVLHLCFPIFCVILLSYWHKKPTNICIHYHLPVVFFNFFFFTKYIQICMCLVSIKQTHAHKNRKSKYVPLCQNILKLTANFFHLSFEGKTTNAYICFGFLI